MVIDRVGTESVKSNPGNARKHPKRQIRLIAKNMQKFGFTHPLMLDENNMTIAGHARLDAARLLQLKEVPAVRLCNLSANEKRALALAENKLAEHSSWDKEMLRVQLDQLTFDTAELTFDLAVTGFDTVEIDQILAGEDRRRNHDPADEVPPLPAAEDAVTKSGDVWVCDAHRVYCGGPRDASS